MKLSKDDILLLTQNPHLDDDELISKILEYCNKYKNDYTRVTKISAFKCYLRDHDLIDPSKLNLIIDKELTNKLKSKINRDGLPDKKPIGRHVIDKLLALKDSDKRDDIFIYLMLASGRRASEFIEGNWKKCEKGHLRIDKLSKKGGDKVHPVSGYHIKPSHGSVDNFLLLHSKLNGLLHNKSNIKIKTKSLLDSAGRTIRKLTQNYLNLSSLRPLYVLLHQLLDTDCKMNPNSKIMKLLHHENHASSSNYNSRFYIEPETKFTETLTIPADSELLVNLEKKK